MLQTRDQGDSQGVGRQSGSNPMKESSCAICSVKDLQCPEPRLVVRARALAGPRAPPPPAADQQIAPTSGKVCPVSRAGTVQTLANRFAQPDVPGLRICKMGRHGPSQVTAALFLFPGWARPALAWGVCLTAHPMCLRFRTADVELRSMCNKCRPTAPPRRIPQTNEATMGGAGWHTPDTPSAQAQATFRRPP